MNKEKRALKLIERMKSYIGVAWGDDHIDCENTGKSGVAMNGNPRIKWLDVLKQRR